MGALVRVQPNAQLNVEKARTFLARCLKVDEVKEVRDQARAVGLYQRSRRASIEAQNDAAEIALRAERRLGELLRKLDKNKGTVTVGGGGPSGGRIVRPPEKPTLSNLGISKSQSSRWQAIAELPKTAFEDHIAAVRDRGEKLTVASTLNAVSHRSSYDGDEWGTPEPYAEAARKVLGYIGLDPASNVRAQKIIRARRFYTKRDNGLVRPWRGPIWLNCAFSIADEFHSKLLEEYDAKRTKAAISLVNNSTETAWFQTMLERFPVCFPKGRIPFLDAQGHPVEGNRQGQAFFYLGPRLALFRRTFSEFGVVVARAA